MHDFEHLSARFLGTLDVFHDSLVPLSTPKASLMLSNAQLNERIEEVLHDMKFTTGMQKFIRSSSPTETAASYFSMSQEVDFFVSIRQNLLHHAHDMHALLEKLSNNIHFRKLLRIRSFPSILRVRGTYCIMLLSLRHLLIQLRTAPNEHISISSEAMDLKSLTQYLSTLFTSIFVCPIEDFGPNISLILRYFFAWHDELTLKSQEDSKAVAELDFVLRHIKYLEDGKARMADLIRTMELHQVYSLALISILPYNVPVLPLIVEDPLPSIEPWTTTTDLPSVDQDLLTQSPSESSSSSSSYSFCMPQLLWYTSILSNLILLLIVAIRGLPLLLCVLSLKTAKVYAAYYAKECLGLFLEQFPEDKYPCITSMLAKVIMEARASRHSVDSLANGLSRVISAFCSDDFSRFKCKILATHYFNLVRIQTLLNSPNDDSFLLRYQMFDFGSSILHLRFIIRNWSSVPNSIIRTFENVKEVLPVMTPRADVVATNALQRDQDNLMQTSLAVYRLFFESIVYFT